jgi:hypothetical protein
MKGWLFVEDSKQAADMIVAESRSVGYHSTIAEADNKEQLCSEFKTSESNIIFLWNKLDIDVRCRRNLK